MKKILSFTLGAIVALAIGYGVTSADLASDIASLLGGSKSFGYSTNDKVTVKNITNNSITFTSPIVSSDEEDDDTIEYILLYGTKAFDIDNIDDFTAAPSKMLSTAEISNGKFDIELTTSANSLDASKIYHAVIIPKIYRYDDDPNAIGNYSNEICFRLSDKKTGEGSNCDGLNGTTTSNTADCNNIKTILNVSCTWNQKTVTVSWTKTKEHLRISLFDEAKNDWTIKKESIDANSSSNFSFDVNQKTAPVIELAATDNLCTPVRYTCHTLSTTTTTPTKTTVKPVVVGPKENIIAIIAGAIILYLVYTVVRRKAN